MPVTRATSRARSTGIASLSPRRVTDSPIRKVREDRPLLRRQRSSAPLFPPSLNPGSTCQSHNLICSCGSSVRPKDHAVYQGKCLPSNRVTERYILNNLRMTQPELDFVTGASLALKDALDTLTPQNHIVQHASNSSLFRVISRPSVPGISGPSVPLAASIISIPELILPFLHDECIFSDINLADLLTDPYEPTTPAEGDWSTIDLDLRAPWNLTLADHREFLAGLIVPLIIRLLQLGSGAPDRAIAEKLVNGIPYFRYLAVRTGFLKVSAAKRAAWTTKVLARKVAVLWGRGSVERAREDVGEIEGLRRRVQEAEENSRKVVAQIQNETERGLEEVRDEVAQVKRVGEVNALDIIEIKAVGEVNALDIIEIKEVGEVNALDIIEIKAVGEVNALDIKLNALDIIEIKEVGEVNASDIIKIQKAGEVNALDIIEIKEVGEVNALDIIKIQKDGEVNASDIIKIQKAGEVNASELGKMHDELEDVKEAGKAMKTQFLTALESGLAAAVEQSLAKYTDIVTTKIEQLVSSTVPSPPLNPAPDDVQGPVDFCDLQIFLRLREGSMTAIDLVSASPGIHRCFTSGEPTDHIARAVTRGLSSSTPFIVAATGFSGGGKSFNAFSPDGLLETILGYLPDVEVTVTEILTSAHYLCGFRRATQASALEICQKITQQRTSRGTPANDESSRSHLAVSFESPDTGRLFGILLDIAGDEGSADRMVLQDEKAVSNNIALNNADWRKMLWELATPGKGVKGFVGSGGISNYKRASKLNSEVVGYLGRMVAQKAANGLPVPMPIVRLLCCVDGRSEGMVAKSLLLINDRVGVDAQ